MILDFIIIGYLLIASYLDIKYKEMPSFIGTSLIFLIFMYKIFEITLYGFQVDLIIVMATALCSVIFAWLLWDMDFIRGMADVKMVIALGLMFAIPYNFVFFVVITLFGGLIYMVMIRTLIRHKLVKKYKNKEYPFIPLFLLMYISYLLAQFIFSII